MTAHGPIVLLFLTEQYKWRQRRALRRRIGHVFALRGRGEYMAGVRRGSVARHAERKPRLRRVTWIYRGRDRWRDTSLGLFLILLTLGGRRVDLRAIVGHFASGAEYGKQYRKDRGSARAVATNRLGFASVAEVVAAELSRHPDWRHLLVGDGNLAQEHHAWVEHVEQLTGMESLWSGEDNPPPTHTSGRTIDFAAVDRNRGLSLDDPRVTGPLAGDDHRGVVFTLGVRVGDTVHHIRAAFIAGRYDAPRKAFANDVARVLNVPTRAKFRKNQSHLGEAA